MPAIRRSFGLTSLLVLCFLPSLHLGAQPGPAQPGPAQPGPAAQGVTRVPPGLFQEMRWRHIGPFRGGRTKAAVGVASQPNIFYIGAVNGGVWRTSDYGRTWVPLFDDEPTGSIRRHRRRAVQPRDHLRRQRRRHAAAGPLDRRWPVSLDGRGPDVDAPRASRRPADCANRRRSPRSAPAVHRRARPPLRPKPRARPVPLHRRRRHAASGSLQGREHRRGRRLHRSEQLLDRLRGAVAIAGRPVGERLMERAGQRTVQVDRRRLHMATADQGPAHLRGGRPGAHRHHGRAERFEPPLRDGRSETRTRRHLPIRRCGRHLAPRQLGPARRRAP